MSQPLDQDERRVLRKKARAATLDGLRAHGGEAQRQQIYKWALAHGDFTARELAAPPPERAGAKYRSAVDHELSWALTNLKREGLLENPKWSTWKLTRVALPTATLALDASVEPARVAELRAMPYPLYLRTREWRRTRAAALLRAGNACSLDATHTENLEVHHRTYERRGAELITDLVVLCHACHELYHQEYGLPGQERREASSSSPSLPPAAMQRDERPPRPRKRWGLWPLRRPFAS